MKDVSPHPETGAEFFFAALGRNTGKVIEVGNNKIAEKISYVRFGDHATNLPASAD